MIVIVYLIYKEMFDNFNPSASCIDDEDQDFFEVLLYDRKISIG